MDADFKTPFTWLHCQCNQSSPCVLAVNNLPRFHRKRLIRPNHRLSLSMPCRDNSMSNSMEIPKLFPTVLIRPPILYYQNSTSAFRCSFPPSAVPLETWGYGYRDKITRVRLLICTYLSYACRCILLKLSVDPSSLKWSYQMVPLSLDFSSTACNITVTSNAHRCALELHFSLESLVRIMHTQDRY